MTLTLCQAELDLTSTTRALLTAPAVKAPTLVSATIVLDRAQATAAAAPQAPGTAVLQTPTQAQVLASAVTQTATQAMAQGITAEHTVASIQAQDPALALIGDQMPKLCCSPQPASLGLHGGAWTEQLLLALVVTPLSK